jgi:hypothetical protein
VQNMYNLAHRHDDKLIDELAEHGDGAGVLLGSAARRAGQRGPRQIATVRPVRYRRPRRVPYR